ncbi:MAG TPA: protein kinase [Steroidobacter sp.]|uniref:protein kinase domain-containing protein n=1 Tax=Steroidobacter sp. TaxID=1978227 RepID=UPI002ED7D502
MSLSIDKDLGEQGENARAVLASWLDDYICGRCDRADMQAQFLSVCRSNPDAPWDALALLDQYQRRGRIDVSLARSLKTDIAQLVFGVANQTESKADTAAESDTTDVTIDTTGSRWRKLIADRDPDSINSEPAVVDPTRRSEPEPASLRRSADDDATAYRRRDDAPAAFRRPVDEDATNFRRREEDAIGFRRDLEEPATRPPPSLKLTEDDAALVRARKEEPASSAHLRGLAGERPSRPSPVPPPGLTSDVLRDRYELISILGRGSMGTVYKALDRHRAHLDASARCVAVKVLKQNFKDRPEELAQLEREFHEAQSLSHPNVVGVFDLDRDGDVYFIVMELLEGELLADILKRLDGQPMARHHALAIIASVGAALAYAHRRNVVHADLKPRNIMITSAGEARVLDFGFARDRPLDLHSASGLHEGPVSAPAYASVERVNGSDPHPSDDVYSLACIAYELLAGRHPFGGRSAPLARAHGRQPQRIPGLTGKQQAVLQRALLWTRGERRIDVVELLAGLGCGSAPNRLGLPTELSVPHRPHSRWRRGVFAMVLAVGFVTGGYLVWQYELLPKNLSNVLPVMPPIADRELQSEVAGGSVVTDPQVDRGDVVGSRPLQPVAPLTVEPLPSSQQPGGPADSASTQSEQRSAPAGEPVESRADTRQNTQTVVPLPPAIREQPKEETSRGQSEQSPAGSNAPAASSSQPESSAPMRPAVIEFDKDSYVTSEGDGSVRLSIRRTGSTRREVSFTWNLRANSAEMGSDFAGIGPGTERIPAGVREASITVPLVQDSIKESTELFLVELQVEGDGVTLGERSSAAVIIVDDD